MVIAHLKNQNQVVQYTDELGKTSFESVKADEIAILEVSHLQFENYILTASGLNNYTISLKKKQLEIQEVVVTGQHGSTSIENSIQKVNVIGLDKINRLAAQNLQQALSNELNISLGNDAVLGGSINLMGISGENIKILIDGIPVSGRLNGNIDPSQLNLMNVERIELVEGPLSVQYGSNALAGTINIITKKRAAQKEFLSLKTYTESIGQYNLQAGIQLLNKKNHSLNLGLQRNFFDGWSPQQSMYFGSNAFADSSRFQLWKPKIQYAARVQYNYNYKKWNFSFKSDALHETLINKGLPRAPYFETAFDEIYTTKRFENSLQVKYKWSEDKNILVQVAHNEYARERNSYFKNLVSLESQMLNQNGASDTTKISTSILRATFTHNLLPKKLSYELGFDGNTEIGQGQRIQGKRQITDAALFTSFNYHLNKKIGLRLGARGNHNSVYGSSFTPAFYAHYALKENQHLRFSVAKGFRSPALKELYLYFVDINHNIKGNENLKAEHSINTQLNYQFNRKIKKANYYNEVKFYYNNIKEQITLVPSSLVEYSYFNIGSYQSYGANWSGKLIYSKLSFGTGINLLKQNWSDAKLSLNKTTPINFQQNGFAAYNLNAKHSISYFLKYYGQSNTIGVNTFGDLSALTIGKYTISDINYGWKIAANTQFNFGVKNLFNVSNIATQGAVSVHSGSENGNRNIASGRLFFLSLDIQLKNKSNEK